MKKYKIFYLFFIIIMALFMVSCDLLDEPSDNKKDTNEKSTEGNQDNQSNLDLVSVEEINVNDQMTINLNLNNTFDKELNLDGTDFKEKDIYKYGENKQYYIFTSSEQKSIKLAIKLKNVDENNRVEKIKVTLNSDFYNHDYKITDIEGNTVECKGGEKVVLDWYNDEDIIDSNAYYLYDVFGNQDTTVKKVFKVVDFKLLGHKEWQSEEYESNININEKATFDFINASYDIKWNTIYNSINSYSWDIDYNDAIIPYLGLYTRDSNKNYHNFEKEENYIVYEDKMVFIEFIYKYNNEYYLWQYKESIQLLRLGKEEHGFVYEDGLVKYYIIATFYGRDINLFTYEYQLGETKLTPKEIVFDEMTEALKFKKIRIESIDSINIEDALGEFELTINGNNVISINFWEK